MIREDFPKLKRGDGVLISRQRDNVTDFHGFGIVQRVEGGRVFFRQWIIGGSNHEFSTTIDDEIVGRMAKLPNLLKLVEDVTTLNGIAQEAVAALKDNEHFAELAARYERCVNNFENVRLYLPGL